MRRRPSALSFAVGVLVALGLVPAAGAADDELAVIGDSLTWAGRADLRRRLEDLGLARVEVDAQPSRRVPLSAPPPYSGVRALRGLRAAGFDPGLFVIALGTNDLGFVARHEGTPRGLITEMLDEIGPGHRVLWVEVARARMSNVAIAWNRALAEVAAERPGALLVYPWSQVAPKHPAWFRPDRVHHTEAGADARVRMVALAAAGLLRGEIPAEALAGPHAAEVALVALARPRPKLRPADRALLGGPRARSPLGATVRGCAGERGWLSL